MITFTPGEKLVVLVLAGPLLALLLLAEAVDWVRWRVGR